MMGLCAYGHMIESSGATVFNACSYTYIAHCSYYSFYHHHLLRKNIFLKFVGYNQ
jgi:hypothetical protein